MQVDLSYDQVVHRPCRTVNMNLQIPSFPLTSGTFLIMPIPENDDVIICMMWLCEQNPDNDWNTGRMTSCNNTKLRGEVKLKLPKERLAVRDAGQRKARIEPRGFLLLSTTRPSWPPKYDTADYFAAVPENVAS